MMIIRDFTLSVSMKTSSNQTWRVRKMIRGMQPVCRNSLTGRSNAVDYEKDVFKELSGMANSFTEKEWFDDMRTRVRRTPARATRGV